MLKIAFCGFSIFPLFIPFDPMLLGFIASNRLWHMHLILKKYFIHSSILQSCALSYFKLNSLKTQVLKVDFQHKYLKACDLCSGNYKIISLSMEGEMTCNVIKINEVKSKLVQTKTRENSVFLEIEKNNVGLNLARGCLISPGHLRGYHSMGEPH
jgi:hypothetical protein